VVLNRFPLKAIKYVIRSDKSTIKLIFKDTSFVDYTFL